MPNTNASEPDSQLTPQRPAAPVLKRSVFIGIVAVAVVVTTMLVRSRDGHTVTHVVQGAAQFVHMEPADEPFDYLVAPPNMVAEVVSTEDTGDGMRQVTIEIRVIEGAELEPGNHELIVAGPGTKEVKYPVVISES